MVRLVHPHDAQISESLDYIRLASRRATELTQQILTYAGKGQFAAVPVQINRIINEIAVLCRTTFIGNTMLVLDLAAGLPEIAGDTTQLHQVVLNLVLNASDALSGRQGTILVMTECATVYHHATLRPGDYVRIIVRDTGSGIDTPTQMRMFDPFFTTKSTGRGLGLATVQGIVRQHHGTIEVQSTPEHSVYYLAADQRYGNCNAYAERTGFVPSDRGSCATHCSTTVVGDR